MGHLDPTLHLVSAVTPHPGQDVYKDTPNALEPHAFHNLEVRHGPQLDTQYQCRISRVMFNHIGELARQKGVEKSIIARAALYSYLKQHGIDGWSVIPSSS